MKTIKTTLTSIVLFLLATSCLSQNNTNNTYVFVHGAYGGGWAFKEVDSLLTAKGNKVYRPTLTGLGEKVHLSSPSIGLDTHIKDILNVILFEELENIILVGHSYGGLVITGVADKVPEKIKKLIYLDAVLPEHNESLFSIFTTLKRNELTIIDDCIIPPWVKKGAPYPKDVPHPLKTLSDTIQLKNPNRKKVSASYIFTVEKDQDAKEDMFFSQAERAKNRNWPVITVEGDHNLQWSNPNKLIQTLLAIVSP